MKNVTFILLMVIAATLLCSNSKQREEAQVLPKEVSIYYDYARCPWFGLKNYSVCPEEFLKYVADTCITLTDNASLKYFKNLQAKSESGKDSIYYKNFETWFSAIVNYGEYNDTISVSGYKIKYNNKQLQDSTTIFYFISKLYAVDKATFDSLDENFYNNGFQKLDFREEKHSSELKPKLQSLGYILKR